MKGNTAPVVIPPAVYREVVESGADYPAANLVQAALGNWISVAEAPSPEKVAALRGAFRLDLGESEAILVAEALGNTPVLMDERRGVRLCPFARNGCNSFDLCQRKDSRFDRQ
jgi:predicted nucleic acid-binding protein